jgi:hypothetical protein
LRDQRQEPHNKTGLLSDLGGEGEIIQRGTALRTEGRLPENLWPEATKTGAYLINRLPSATLGWKTPYQRLQEAIGSENERLKPKLSHLRAYGCKAYALNKNRARLDKLDPRAFVGYLVGYESTNIYRIWIPSKNRVLTTRDVTFDETARYDPIEPQEPEDEAIQTLEESTQPTNNWQIEEWDTEDVIVVEVPEWVVEGDRE